MVDSPSAAPSRMRASIAKSSRSSATKTASSRRRAPHWLRSPRRARRRGFVDRDVGGDRLADVVDRLGRELASDVHPRPSGSGRRRSISPTRPPRRPPPADGSSSCPCRRRRFSPRAYPIRARPGRVRRRCTHLVAVLAEPARRSRSSFEHPGLAIQQPSPCWNTLQAPAGSSRRRRHLVTVETYIATVQKPHITARGRADHESPHSRRGAESEKSLQIDAREHADALRTRTRSSPSTEFGRPTS